MSPRRVGWLFSYVCAQDSAVLAFKQTDEILAAPVGKDTEREGEVARPVRMPRRADRGGADRGKRKESGGFAAEHEKRRPCLRPFTLATYPDRNTLGPSLTQNSRSLDTPLVPGRTERQREPDRKRRRRGRREGCRAKKDLLLIQGDGEMRTRYIEAHARTQTGGYRSRLGDR